MLNISDVAITWLMGSIKAFYRNAKESSNLLRQGIGVRHQKLKDIIFFFKTQPQNIVDVLEIILFQYQGHHLCVMGIRFTDKYLINIIFTPRITVHGIEHIIKTIE